MSKIKKYLFPAFIFLCILFLFTKYCQYKKLYNDKGDLINEFEAKYKNESENYRREANEKKANIICLRKRLLESDAKILSLSEKEILFSKQVENIKIRDKSELQELSTSKQELLQQISTRDDLILSLNNIIGVKNQIIAEKDKKITDLTSLVDINRNLLNACDLALKDSEYLVKLMKMNKPRKKWFVFGPGVTVGYNGNLAAGVSVVLNLWSF